MWLNQIHRAAESKSINSDIIYILASRKNDTGDTRLVLPTQ